MLAQDIRRDTIPRRRGSAEALHDEDVELARRVSHLRGALEAAQRDNADLRRRLARVIRENEELRQGTVPGARHAREHREHWREALSEPWSRNP